MSLNKNRAAMSLGRKGGKARAKKLSVARRKEIATIAVQAPKTRRTC